jgi:outer membrane protein OmpA-like peptidoglycan-associated protein
MRNLSETVCSKLKWFAPLVVLTLSGAAGAAGSGSTDTSAQTPICKDSGVSLTFAEGSAELDRNARGALAGVATWIGNGETRSVKLAGFADKKGNAEFNQRLSEQRAQAAKDFLVAHGANPDKVTIVGLGEEQNRHDTPSEQRVVMVSACDTPSPPVAQAEPEPEAAPAPAPEPAPAPIVIVPPAEPAPVAALPPAPAPRKGPASRIGIEAAVGLGAVGFIDEGAKDMTGTGEQWDARLTFGSRSYVAVEAAYVGSVQSIEALGLSQDARLLGNGAEGTLRLNFTRARIQPYVFGGAGWTHYQLNNTPTVTSDVRATDDVGTVPLGAGIAARLGKGFLVDVRGTYRATFNEDLLNAAMVNGQSSSLQSWNVGGRVGFEF